MKKILAAKHWQVFLSVYGLYFLFKVIMIFFKDRSIELKLLPLFIALSGIMIFVWLWVIGISASSKISNLQQVSIKIFKFCIILIVGYILALALYMFGYGFPEGPFFVAFDVIFMATVFYCLNFVTRSLKTLENGKPVAFSEYFGELILIFLFPIGIWFVQPKINKIFRSQDNE